MKYECVDWHEMKIKLNKIIFRFEDQYEEQLNQTKFLHKVMQCLASSSPYDLKMHWEI